jgi:hypothetical protein
MLRAAPNSAAHLDTFCSWQIMRDLLNHSSLFVQQDFEEF